MKANELMINKSTNVITTYLVQYISSKYEMSKEDALKNIMTTFTYETLLDKTSKLYSESKEYVLDMLINELNSNMQEWMKI